jgi:enoyl-CoA hydratase/carnithine racemase
VSGALSLAEAVERLRSPEVFERCSPISGEPALVVELGASAEATPGCSAETRAALAALPCPSVAIARERETAPGAARWLGCFDVVVRSDADLASVLAAVRRAPLAAQVLVQLLRGSERRDVEAGLIAESLAYSTLQGGPEFAAWAAARPPARRRSEASGPPLRVRRDGARLHVTLDRPERRNAWSAAMRDAFVEALALAVADASIHEVWIDAVGPAFCSGGDLDEFGTRPDPATAHAVRTTRSAARLLAACAERVRAQLHGACIGAGIELAAFAARVAAREGAFFQLPELAMGLIPGAGGTVSLPRRIGRQRTAWLALSGARLEVGEALSWGLVDEVLPSRA